MKKLTLKLNQDYKSFPSNFEIEVEGDLVIISGVNGSGKTQIIDIIRGYQLQDQNKKINRTINFGGVVLNSEDVAHKSFRDYSSIGNVTEANVTNSVNARNDLWNWYKNYGLDYEGGALNNHRQVAKDVRKILIDTYGPEKFNSRTITQLELNGALPKDFVLYIDDIFTNRVGEIFFNYASIVHNKYAEAGRQNHQFDLNTLPEAPWLRLNKLFRELNFSYRFKDSYERIDDIINEQPAIYGLTEAGVIDELQKRSLQDLSDGEKAIISLAFAMIASEQTHPKILLLDEYDATLNPSLIEAFFIVLKNFFVDKGTQVIIVTHSSATIALAPEYARFYEVFKLKANRPRILEVNRHSYEELQEVYKKYYQGTGNEESRVREIEIQNTTLKIQNISLQASVDALTKPLVITEGKTDQVHLQKALQKLGITDLNVEIFNQDSLATGLGSSRLMQKLVELSSVPHAQRIIGIFDRDEVEYINSVGDLKKFGNNVYAFCIPAPATRMQYQNISIEYYYSDNEIKKEHNGKRIFFTNEVEEVKSMTNKSSKVIKICSPKFEEELSKKIYDDDVVKIPAAHSKSVFAELVKNDEEFSGEFNFDNFRLIFDKLKEIIGLQ